MLFDKARSLGRLIVQLQDEGKLPDSKELEDVLWRLADIMTDIQDIEAKLPAPVTIPCNELYSNVVRVNFPRRIPITEQNGGGAA